MIKHHHELEVYRLAFVAAMRIFELSREFPREERYSLTDQVRRASRSVCANLAEGWRKRRYMKAFVLKLNDSEAEAAEVQTWIRFAVQCHYVPPDTGRDIERTYDQVIGKLVTMINDPTPWLLK